MTAESAPQDRPETEPLNEVLIGEIMVDLDKARERWGLGSEELSQVITFGRYNGTFAEALADEACPIGGTLEKAYAKDGLNGVEQKLKAISELDEAFTLKVSEATEKAENEKKNFLEPELALLKPSKAEDEIAFATEKPADNKTIQAKLAHKDAVEKISTDESTTSIKEVADRIPAQKINQRIKPGAIAHQAEIKASPKIVELIPDSPETTIVNAESLKYDMQPGEIIHLAEYRDLRSTVEVEVEVPSRNIESAQLSEEETQALLDWAEISEPETSSSTSMGNVILTNIIEFAASERLVDKDTIDIEDDIESTLTFSGENIDTVLEESMDHLSQEQAEVVYGLIDQVGELAHEINALDDKDVSLIEKPLQELEELCAELFDNLGINYNKDSIKRFIQNIITQESITSIEPDNAKYEYLNIMGTREYKVTENTSLFKSLTRYIKIKFHPSFKIGEYVVRSVAA